MTIINCTELYGEQECGGTMTLTDVYCRINRARGMEVSYVECLCLRLLGQPLSLSCRKKVNRGRSATYQTDMRGCLLCICY